MKKRIILTIQILTFMMAFVALIRADQDLELKAEKISPSIVRLAGAQNAIYSPSGKFVAIQVSGKFLLLPAGNLVKSFDELSKLRSWDGQIMGFLPSDTLVYSYNEEIFGLAPLTQKSRKLLSRYISEQLAGRTFIQNEFVLVSDDLIITGDGSYDMGGYGGNIYRYDLKKKRLARGAKIKQFWYAALSPSRNYILYERGGEQSNFMDFYDIRQDRNYEAARYFKFRKVFPKFRKTSESPLLWVGNRDRFLAYITSGEHPDDIKPEDEEEQGKTWLALFDVPTGKIVWKKLTDKGAFPSAFQPLDAGKMLINYDEEVFELSLANGKERKISGINGKSLVVSPDKKKIAFIKSNQVFTASTDGSNKKPVLELPPEWIPEKDYKGMGEHSPMWSGTGEALILFGENQLLIAQL